MLLWLLAVQVANWLENRFKSYKAWCFMYTCQADKSYFSAFVHRMSVPKT